MSKRASVNQALARQTIDRKLAAILNHTPGDRRRSAAAVGGPVARQPEKRIGISGGLTIHSVARTPGRANSCVRGAKLARAARLWE